jgi:hypothetical protein
MQAGTKRTLWVLICNRLSAENGHRSLRTFASCSTTCLRHVVASSRGPALRQNVQVMSLQTAQAAPRQRQLAQSGLAASTLGRPRRCQRCLALRSSVQRCAGTGGCRSHITALYWLLPGALRHVVQVHMTGDDWQPLPAQQLPLSPRC